MPSVSSTSSGDAEGGNSAIGCCGIPINNLAAEHLFIELMCASVESMLKCTLLA